MAPKRSSKSTAPSKGTPKSTAPPIAGTRKSARARGGSSEPRQLRSNSEEAQSQFDYQDPEQILRESKRKNKQSSRASSRASTQEPDDLVVDRGAELAVEPSLEPVREAFNEPSQSPPVIAEVEAHQQSVSHVSREQSSEHEDQGSISIVRHSSVEFSVETEFIAPTVEEHVENTPFSYSQHNLSLIVEEPTEESILDQHTQPSRYTQQSSSSTTHYTQYTQERESAEYDSGTFAETAREPSFSSDDASPPPATSTSRASVRQRTIDPSSDDEDAESDSSRQTPIAARQAPVDMMSESEDEDQPAPQAQNETFLESVIEDDNYRPFTRAQGDTILDTVIEEGDYSPAPLAQEETHPESVIELSSGSEEEEAADDDEGQDDYDMDRDAEDDYSEVADEDEYEGQYEDQYEDQYQGQHQMLRGQEPILEEDTTLTQTHKYLAEHEREYGQYQGQSAGHETQVSTPRGNKSSKGMSDIFHISRPVGQGEPTHGAMATLSGQQPDGRHHLDPEEGDDTLTLAFKAELRRDPSLPSTPVHQITTVYDPAIGSAFAECPNDTPFTAEYKEACRELEAEEKALKARQGAMGPPLTPASASRRLSGRQVLSTYRPSNLGSNRYPQVETPDHIDHLFNTSLTGYEDSEMVMPDQEVDTSDHLNHLFSTSLTGFEESFDVTTPKNCIHLPSSVSRSSHDAQTTAPATDKAAPINGIDMEDEDFSLSSPFNPTSTSTPLHMMQQSRQVPDSPIATSDHEEVVDEIDKIVVELDECPTERDEATKALLASLEPATFAAAEIAKHHNQTTNLDCATCAERACQQMVPQDAVVDLLSTYQEAVIPLRDLEGNCYQDYVQKVKSLTKEVMSSTEKIQVLTDTCAKYRNENNVLRNENYKFDRRFLKLRKEAEDAKDKCSRIEARSWKLITQAEKDKATIQLLQKRITQLQAQMEARDITISNDAADSFHTTNQNHSLNSISADFPSQPADKRGHDNHDSSRAFTNKSFAVSKPSPQPMIVDDQLDEDPFTESDDNTTPTKEDSIHDTTAVDASEAPSSAEASHTPAALAPTSFFSRAFASIASPIKFFVGSPAKETSLLAGKKVSTIKKLDQKPYLKPNNSSRQQKLPRTPIKSMQRLESDHHNTSRSVRFDAVTPRDDSEAVEHSATAQAPTTSSKQLYFIYLHHGPRTRFYKKWTALQASEKARILSGVQETSVERQNREHLEELKVLVEQAEDHIRERNARYKAASATASATKLSKKRNAVITESTEGSPVKKQRLAFEQQRTTTPPGVERPIPGEDGYHMSTQLPSTRANNWVSESVRALPSPGEDDTSSSSQVFGAGSRVPGASLGSNSVLQTPNEPKHQRSQGRTFEVPSDDEDDTSDAQEGSISQKDSVVSQTVGRTFALNYDEFSESEDESMEDAAAWKGKPFNEWTKSTMTAYKEAPLPSGVAPAEQSLLNAVTSIIAGHCPDPIHSLVNSSDHPRIAELGMTPDDFLTVSYPDNRGVVTYTRQSYYHWTVKPPGTEDMNNQERATWKCMEEFRNWRKFSEVVRLYQQDDTPSLVAKIDGRLQDVQKKRKRIEDEEQEIHRKEQELERRNKRLMENEKELDRLREEQLQKQKAVATMPQPPVSKQTVFNSLMTDLEEQSQTAQAGPSVQQAAARVSVPSSTKRHTGQAPLSSVISPQNPPPYIYDANGNVVLTTQPGATSSTTASAPAWTQSPPPAPTPAHAQLPPQAKTTPAPAPAVQPSNKYAPKKPSRLRESTTYSPGPNVQQSIENNEDWRLMIPEPQQVGSLFGPGRLTPPAEVEYGGVEEGLKALDALMPLMRREPGYYGGPSNLP